MEDKKNKNKYFIVLIMVIVFIAIFFLIRNNNPKMIKEDPPVFVDGIRTQVFGLPPEEADALRRDISNRIKNGVNGIPMDHISSIERQIQQEKSMIE